MLKKARDGNMPVHVTYLTLSLLLIAASAILSTNGSTNSLPFPGFSVPLRLPCMFKFLTGFNCPACGLTRSFIYMSHLNPGSAFVMNHAGPLLYALCVFEVPYRAVLLLRGDIPFHRAFAAFEAVLFTAFLFVDLLFFLLQFLVLL